MNDFTFHMYTDIVFGHGAEKRVAEKVRQHGGSKVLMVYGGGSIKQMGLYDTVASTLNEAGIAFVELPGVQANPRFSLAKKGVELAKAEGVDFVLAVGGGSTIDTAKAIAMGMANDASLEDLYNRRADPVAMAPVGTIHTISAAGSETSMRTVLKLDDEPGKVSTGGPMCRPVFALMNPELTFTVSAYQSACGAVDVFAHTFERYFVPGECTLGERFAISLMRTVVDNALTTIQEPENYEARGEIMLAGAFSHNDFTALGRGGMEGASHGIESNISGRYDTAHGAGLAVLMPAILEVIIDKRDDLRLPVGFATEVFDVPADFGDERAIAVEGVARFRAWLRSIGMPNTLSELGAPADSLDDLIASCHMGQGKTIGLLSQMDDAEVAALLTRIM